MGRSVTDLGQDTKVSTQIKKHAATIHCSNTLSLLQRKVSNALLYHAYKELMLKEEHEITVKQLCRLIGYHGNNHAAIKDALKGLISTVIEWNLIDDKTGAENWTASSILASVSLEGPLCYFAYSPRMKQLLHSPSMFGKIDLVIQSKFRSSYGLALYENCIRYRGLPHTKWFDMALFKKLMGIPEGMYDVFRDFKRRVLDKAVDEVNSHSDLVIEADYGKEGRKFVKVRFKLKERAKKTRLGNKALVAKKSPSTNHPAIVSQLMDEFSLSLDQVEQLLASYDQTFVEEKVAMIKASKPYQQGKIENTSAYLISAVKNDYKTSKTKQPQVIQLQEARQEIEMSDLKRQAEDIRQDYNLFRETAIHAVVDNLPEKEKKQFNQDFLDFAEPVISTVLQLQRNKYSRDTVLQSPQVKSLMRRFAVRELDFIAVPTLEEFVASLSEEAVQIWQKLKSYDPDNPILRFGE
ncbi:MAG: replication initiation protein [Gammaproteobacteria bacterium]